MVRNIVARLRVSRGWTQEELAAMVGISRPALSAIESGTVPKGMTMLNISRALSLPVNEIFFLDDVRQTQQS